MARSREPVGESGTAAEVIRTPFPKGLAQPALRAPAGAGVPLLPAPAMRLALKLTGHKLYAKTGIMSLEYVVQYGRGSKRRR